MSKSSSGQAKSGAADNGRPLTTSFAAFQTRRRALFKIPFQGTFVFVRLQSMTAAELIWLKQTFSPADVPFYCVAMCVVDEHDHRTHTIDAEGIAAIQSMDSQLFDALYELISTYCLNQVPVGELVKNSAAMRNGAPPSASPDNTAEPIGATG